MTRLWYSHEPFMHATKKPQEMKGNIQVASDLLTVSSHTWLGSVLTETWENMRRIFGKMRSNFVLRTSELKMPKSNHIFSFFFILPHSYLCSHLLFYWGCHNCSRGFGHAKIWLPIQPTRGGDHSQRNGKNINSQMIFQHLQAGIILISSLSHFSSGLLTSLEKLRV